MHNESRIALVDRKNEEQFIRFLETDKLRHVFTLYDLRNFRDKTRIWAMWREKTVEGYLFEYDRRIIHTHGSDSAAENLLKTTQLMDPIFVIEPRHLPIVNKSYAPTAPTDAASTGMMTTYKVMTMKAKDFKPDIKHPVKRLGQQNVSEAFRSLGEEYGQRIQEAVTKRSVACGGYAKHVLASVALVPETVNGIALIRGVYTVTAFRNQGLSTSTMSGLVKELLDLGKEPALWVAEDNFPARHVYERIGFKSAGFTLLGFKARRL